MKIRLERLTSAHSDFQVLVKLLDKELKVRDGEDHEFYHQFNKIDSIKYVVVAYADDSPVGCGALKQYDEEKMELKRMFVLEDWRSKGVATTLILELEKWCKELGFNEIILETGINQPEAIQLYKKMNYNSIENYGQYKYVEYSFCFQKSL